MQPRKKNSIHWTAFPKEFEQQLSSVLVESFASQSKEGQFIVQSRIYPNEILLRIGYLKSKQISQFNAEASVEYDSKQENAKDIINLAIDSAASVLSNYFEDPKGDFPIQWEIHKVGKKDVYLQTSKVNTNLESKADELLNESEENNNLYKN